MNWLQSVVDALIGAIVGLIVALVIGAVSGMVIEDRFDILPWRNRHRKKRRKGNNDPG